MYGLPLLLPTVLLPQPRLFLKLLARLLLVGRRPLLLLSMVSKGLQTIFMLGGESHLLLVW